MDNQCRHVYDPPENIGKRLGIDETMLHKDLMTSLTNKEGHGKRHTLIAAVKGTKASDIIKVLMQIPQEQREQVEDLCNCAILWLSLATCQEKNTA